MIRPLRAADAARAARIAAASMPQPWSEAAFLQETANPSAYLLGAFEDIDGAGASAGAAAGDCGRSAGRMLGYLSLALTPDDAELTGIAVDPAFPRRGIAGDLLCAAREALRGRRIDTIVLEVRASNAAAIVFYEKYGFTCIGRRRDFYTSPREDALVMTDGKDEKDEER